MKRKQNPKHPLSQLSVPLHRSLTIVEYYEQLQDLPILWLPSSQKISNDNMIEWFLLYSIHTILLSLSFLSSLSFSFHSFYLFIFIFIFFIYFFFLFIQDYSNENR